MTIRTSLARWIGDLGAQGYVHAFPRSRIGRPLAPVLERFDDYYLSLVGELFDLMRRDETDPADWAVLGNALADIATSESRRFIVEHGISRDDALLFGSTAFYFGGYPASAYLVAQELTRAGPGSEVEQACVELLVRPATAVSDTVTRLAVAIRAGDLSQVATLREEARARSAAALELGPEAWIPARLLDRLLERFAESNIRVVLPDGMSESWDALVESLMARRPPIWEFFPSQIQAIRAGLLSSATTFSLQMPTGAGKTALCETLLYRHVQTHPGSAAVLLVPYRSLASELRRTMVRRLGAMGISARCVYGGTVPTGDETREIVNASVVVATPEALSGLLADDSFYRRVSLVICDEGHLLDSGGRGVALELLLARMRAREIGPPRFVLLSAIVPNIEEINTWLGGTDETVVVSDYRPAIAEFAILRPGGAPTAKSVDLIMHPEADAPTSYTVRGFLSERDFQWTNPRTGRVNTLPWRSIKTMAVAAARKTLPLGAVAVFTATKSGNQGAIGLAAELVGQLQHQMALPAPDTFADTSLVAPALEYLALEYGTEWVGTKALRGGAVLHHGDIPQETREVLEHLVRGGGIRLVICTTTLAEGVNLPLRTLVLYTTRRRTRTGRAQDLLTRDIKNLVGRAGRPGATTRGLVICANEREWPLVEPVARQRRTEPVRGALHKLLVDLRRALARRPVELSNAVLEATERLHPLVDGVDATLIDLTTEELGEAELVAIATRLASQTFASAQADVESEELLEQVFALRARRVLSARDSSRLAWIRASGARLRHVDGVVEGLLPRRQQWDDITDPMDLGFVGAVLDWAWEQNDLRGILHEAYRLADSAELEVVRIAFMSHVHGWLEGKRFAVIAARTERGLDDTMRIHAQAVSYSLQTIVEQGLSLLAMALESTGRTLSPAAVLFSEHLRYGVPDGSARSLAAEGIRHRSAVVELGATLTRAGVLGDDSSATLLAAMAEIDRDRRGWTNRLGRLVFTNTRADIAAAVGRLTEAV